MTNYLFPDLSPETENLMTPQVPVLHTLTRQKFYSIVNLLCKHNDVNLAQVMDQLEDIIPRGLLTHCLLYLRITLADIYCL